MKKLSFLVSVVTVLSGLSAMAGTSVHYACNPIPGAPGHMDENSYAVVRDRTANGPEKVILDVNGKPESEMTIAPSLPGEMKYTCSYADVTIAGSEPKIISIKSKKSTYSADCVKK